MALEKIYSFPFLSKPLPEYPFGKELLASREKYLSLYKFAINQDDKKVMNLRQKCGYSINKEWFNLFSTTNTTLKLKKEKLNFFHGRLLYSLLSKYLKKQKMVSISL